MKEGIMKNLYIFSFWLLVVLCNMNLVQAQWVKTNGWTSDCDLPMSIVVSPDNSKIYTGDFGCGVFLSTDSGLNWKQINDGLLESGTSDSLKQVKARYISNLAFSYTSGDTALFAATYGGIYRLKGAAWTGSWFSKYSGYNAVYQMVAKHDGTTLLAYIGDLGMYRSVDNGASWSKTKSQLFSLHPFFLSASPNDSLIFTGGSFILPSGADTAVVLESSDNGDNWVHADSGLTGARALAFTFVPNGNGGSDLLAGTNTGLFLSVDNGNAWVKIDSISVSAFAQTSDGLHLFAGGTRGVFISNNKGRNWTSIDNTFGNVNCLAVSNKYIYAGAISSGVYRRPLSEVTSVKISASAIPSRFKLEQNYPNPFNPGTTIKYSLPVTANVKIEVFNVLGDKVATLVNGFEQAGNHKVYWNAGKFASGIYLYRLHACSTVLCRMMILLK